MDAYERSTNVAKKNLADILPSIVEAENFSDHPPYGFFSLTSTSIDHNLKVIKRLYQRHVSPFFIKLLYIETSFVIIVWRWFYQEAETCRWYYRLIISKLMICVIEVDVRLKKLYTKSRMVTVRTDLSIGSEYLYQRISVPKNICTKEYLYQRISVPKNIILFGA
jgi:hypothetical protein